MGSYPQIPVDFGFTEEHDVLRQSARRFLSERCTLQDVRRIAESASGFDAGLWKEIVELGWTGLVIPEAHGGAGLDHLSLALLVEETGRALLPSPLLATLFAGFAVEAAGDEKQRARLLPAIASGDVIGTLALCETEGAWLPEELRATAEPSDDGFVLRGVKPLVLAGSQAGLVVAPFREPGGRLSLFAVSLPTAGLSVEDETGVDPTRRTARLRFDGVRVGREARLERDGARALAAVHLRATAALAAEMVGGAETVLGLVREYAIARKQFERQIGSFQGVKYPIVDMMIGVELSRTHALGAAAALDHASERAEVAVRMAKAIASDTYASAVRKGVQIHGGYGFTWDCDVHWFFKRALWSRACLGDAVHHRRALAAELFDAA
ncbi:MAG TPA: acyl-CoA dehydrogenase family protein [Myxococcota bacterium]|jgi:alkylation response protein AidB-like acyl-CoA dehydrogenase|nr:acyl-CoA dehydrogenase family protein [Myxococcota bacterium]